MGAARRPSSFLSTPQRWHDVIESEENLSTTLHVRGDVGEEKIENLRKRRKSDLNEVETNGRENTEEKLETKHLKKAPEHVSLRVHKIALSSSPTLSLPPPLSSQALKFPSFSPLSSPSAPASPSLPLPSKTIQQTQFPYQALLSPTRIALRNVTNVSQRQDHLPPAPPPHPPSSSILAKPNLPQQQSFSQAQPLSSALTHPSHTPKRKFSSNLAIDGATMPLSIPYTGNKKVKFAPSDGLVLISPVGMGRSTRDFRESIRRFGLGVQPNTGPQIALNFTIFNDAEDNKQGMKSSKKVGEAE